MKAHHDTTTLSEAQQEHFNVASTFCRDFTSAEFKKRYLEMYPKRSRNSILPSDFSWNNTQSAKEDYPSFLETTPSLTYRFVGLDVGQEKKKSTRVWQIRDGTPHSTLQDALHLDPAAVSRWIARLQTAFPGLDRFDGPDLDFDSTERSYKLETVAELDSALQTAGNDREFLSAVVSAMSKSNLLQWRAYWSMSPKGDGDLGRIAAALRTLAQAAQGPTSCHGQALSDFAETWMAAVPKAQRDHARQIGEFILMHLSRDEGIYIRHSVREDLWREGYGTGFPGNGSLADIYNNELRFMRDVRSAFQERGLAPRDMIDVQSALWIIHNHSKTKQSAEPEEQMRATAPHATNLILYGPPGTGKTYHSAWEAVRLCLGKAATSLQGDDKRDDLMAEYRRLVAQGRIAFVTFHQSMSYEEFVEGLRPETRPAAEVEMIGEELSPGAFHLKVEDGILKQISDRAFRDHGNEEPGNRLDRSRRIIRLGLTGSSWREKLRRAIKESAVEWPHGGDIDWSASEYESWEAIKARRQQDDSTLIGNHPTVYGTWLIRAGAETGDYILLTVGKSKIVALGRFSGEYRFEPSHDGQPTRHTRPIEWLWSDPEGVDREDIYGKDFTSFHPAYPLFPNELDWDVLDQVVFGVNAGRRAEAARPYVLIIDEINRANISKVFGEMITLLEPDKRLGRQNEIRLVLPYSKKSFGVPANLHIIGTMNTADRSIALLDTALRRRFTFRELMPDPSVLSANVDGINLQKLLSTINDRIEYLFDREHQIGHAYFTGCKSRADVEEVMRHKVIPLLAEYFYEDWSRVAAVLGERALGPARFLEARQLSAPPGISEDDLGGEKLRWRVKDQFDFSEFKT